MLFYIILASMAEILVAFAGMIFIFLGAEKFKRKISSFISFSVGTFLALIFIDILPETIEMTGSPETAFLYTLFGFLLFFVISRFLHWYHHHNEGYIVCNEEGAPQGCVPALIARKKDPKTTGYLLLAGDALHNFIDGIIIAFAFLADFNIGVVTTIAVLFHEFPQEAADFFVLIHAGFSRTRALFYNFLSSLGTLAGALIAYALASTSASAEALIGPALGIVAGNFLYIAASDLIPELHERYRGGASTFSQFFLIVAGILMMYLVITFIGE